MNVGPEPAPRGDADRLAQAEEALREVLEERNRLWAELNERLAQEQELEHYRRLLDQYESSLSWRLTAPLRSGMAFLRRLRSLAHKARAHLRGSG